MKAGNFDVELGRIKNQCLELINPQKMCKHLTFIYISLGKLYALGFGGFESSQTSRGMYTV